MTHTDYIRMRRARRDRIPGAVSEWRPDFLPNLMLWLDASKIINKSNGEAISIWEDSSPQQNHAVMTTGSMQPTFVYNGSIPAVRFDGINDWLETTNNMPGGSGSISIYAMIYPTDDTNRSFLGWGAEATRQFMGLNISFGSPSGNLEWIWYGYDADFFSVQQDEWHYLAVIYAQKPILSTFWRQLQVDNQSVNYDPFAEPLMRDTTPGKAKIGLATSTNVPFLGDIAEILVYDPAPNNDTIDGMLETFQIKHYFRVKYGLP